MFALHVGWWGWRAEEVSVFQWHHGLVAAAEGRYVLEGSVGLSYQHDGAKAEDGVAIFRHVPGTRLAGLVWDGLIDGPA